MDPTSLAAFSSLTTSGGPERSEDACSCREATAGIEPAMRVLQTLALPLGDVAWELQEPARGLSGATTAT